MSVPRHKTSIEWTHVPGYIGATLNPIRARDKKTGKVGWFCVHASEGCRNCYAEVINRRFGTGVDFKKQNRDQIELFLDEKILVRPLGADPRDGIGTNGHGLPMPWIRDRKGGDPEEWPSDLRIREWPR